MRSSVWLRALQAQAGRVSWQPSRTFAVEVEEQLSGDIVRALVDGVTDLGALADNIPAHGLTITLFQTDELVLSCAGTHPLAHHRRIDFKDWLVHDFVGLSCGSSLLALISRAAKQAGLPMRLRVATRADRRRMTVTNGYERGPARAAVALWRLYFETGHRHGDSLIDRTTGSCRLPRHSQGAIGWKSADNPRPADFACASSATRAASFE